jgi:hypothetical protein
MLSCECWLPRFLAWADGASMRCDNAVQHRPQGGGGARRDTPRMFIRCASTMDVANCASHDDLDCADHLVALPLAVFDVVLSERVLYPIGVACARRGRASTIPITDYGVATDYRLRCSCIVCVGLVVTRIRTAFCCCTCSCKLYCCDKTMIHACVHISNTAIVQFAIKRITLI